MSDRHVRRSGDDYAHALTSLLPTGLAWPREADTVLMRAVRGLAQIWGYVDQRAADLLERESDPRSTVELLPEWERAFGLPDECLAEPLTVADRQIALVVHMTMIGAQDRAFFYAMALALGYDITIREFSPFMVGVSRVGDTRPTGASGEQYRWEIGAPEMRFYWTVRVGQVRFSWFRVSSGQTGVDPHLRIALATDLECIFNRMKPAHTIVLFDYTGMDVPDPMAGTP